MSKFCGKIVTISTNLTGDGEYLIEEDGEINWWTVDMIESLVERNGKTYPYKIGDRVILKGNNRCATITDLKYNSFGNLSYYIKIDNDKDISVDIYDNMIEGLVKEETTDCSKCGLTPNSVKCLFMDNCPHNKQKNIIEIPEGYVLKDENGKEILTSKIILEKLEPKYPKTFLGCCDVLNIENLIERGVKGYKAELFDTLQKLFICRDAYWKIAGEELGLGKPWEPDWREARYIIYRNQDNIIGGYREAGHVEHHIFEFPTPEMRNAFRENFGPDLEICKDFL